MSGRGSSPRKKRASKPAAASRSPKRSKAKTVVEEKKDIEKPADQVEKPVPAAAESRNVLAEIRVFFPTGIKYSRPAKELKELVIANGGVVLKNIVTCTHLISTQEAVGQPCGKNTTHLTDDSINHAVLPMRVVSEAFLFDSISKGELQGVESYILNKKQ